MTIIIKIIYCGLYGFVNTSINCYLSLNRHLIKINRDNRCKIK